MIARNFVLIVSGRVVKDWINLRWSSIAAVPISNFSSDSTPAIFLTIFAIFSLLTNPISTISQERSGDFSLNANLIFTGIYSTSILVPAIAVLFTCGANDTWIVSSFHNNSGELHIASSQPPLSSFVLWFDIIQTVSCSGKIRKEEEEYQERKEIPDGK